MKQDDFKNNQEISFSQLMGRNGVRIPPIQREYAQGREDAYAIRHGFVETLLKCASEPVHLDFVYGVLDDDGMLVPLDGQQRLTTLLLFYWYFGAIEKSWKFVYDSRRMAMCFVEFLHDEDHKKYLSEPPKRQKKPSEWLKNHNGFVPAWESDSTVAGMLVMLDEIHSQADKCIAPDALDRISFFFHQCDYAISPPETYLKINARGEALTEWENIKSILDSRANTLAIKIQGKTDDPVVLAARKWKKCINGDWTSCLECFLPKPDNNSLPAYIAVSIAMLNAAFRNIIDLAAAATINASQIVDQATKKRGEDVLSEESFSVAILGERLRAASVKNIEDLTEFYTEAFLHHTAIYSDYRNNSVWTDEAFVVVAKIFSSLENMQQSRAVGFWPTNRAKNIYWGGDGDLTLFKKEFLFSSVEPTDASLDEDEKQGFKTFLESFRQTDYSGVDFTYPHALRMLSIARSNASSNGDFALSRCLNFLDADCFNVSTRNFHELNETLSRFQKSLAAGNQEKAFSGLPLNNWRLVKWRFEHVVKSERCKSDLFLGKGNDVDVRQFSFWRIERKLALLSGVIQFTYDGEANIFDESKADFFLTKMMCHDNVAEDQGFLSLMEFMPESPYFMTLPTSSKKDNEGYSQWRDFLLQQQVEDAFDILFVSKSSGMTNATYPDWVKYYKTLVITTCNSYKGIGQYQHEFYGMKRVFAYDSVNKITKGSMCLTYSEEELEVLHLVRNGRVDCFISYGRERYVPFASNDYYAISIDSIIGRETNKLEIRVRDNLGNAEIAYLNMFQTRATKIATLKRIIAIISPKDVSTTRCKYLP